MGSHYAIGLDYGTNSCRSLIVDLVDGRELATVVFSYPSGSDGVILDPADPNVARHNPQDYIDGLELIIKDALRAASDADETFDPGKITGIGIATTGSTPLPVDAQCLPLSLHADFKDNPAAMAWLWKDHTSHEEAAQITGLAASMRPEYLAKCGGTYSSEWFWSKVLHCKRTAPEVFQAAHSFVECCDYIPALLVGITDPAKITRSVCAAGHKAMYSDDWGGLPDEEFLAALDPALAKLRRRLYEKAVPSNHPVGSLCEDWAARLGLKSDVSIAVGAFDAHMGAVGAGIKEGTLVKILGTSTCDIMVVPADRTLADIPGVCGIVKGSVLPNAYAVEAGQSAVGDIFLWFVNHLVPERYGKTNDAKFAKLAELAAELVPGEHGLLCLDWNNGNRTILVDPMLTGLMLGQTLHSQSHEVYRALVEATAFGARMIIDRIEEYGVQITEVVTCGGLAGKNAMLMQIYADVIGRPMKISSSDQTCALGAAIFGAVSAGSFASVAEAQGAMCRVRDESYQPDPARHACYTEIYGLYRELHNAFGAVDWNGNLGHVMKELIRIREHAKGLI